ncbi:hypothetical protein [Pseudobutyrivibrio sp.]|uniref:hypothetical protein n=1 Tax=Pseudobutyrivibrio sp. TaxID=2014367 RepID=UPI001D988BE4|nr:hypothetical protein [Pseudobutyrivibrio sp.]MBE5912266.1 hypothetical protein [Pseudobutyrivibrio sp.]
MESAEIVAGDGKLLKVVQRVSGIGEETGRCQEVEILRNVLLDDASNSKTKILRLTLIRRIWLRSWNWLVVHV